MPSARSQSESEPATEPEPLPELVTGLEKEREVEIM